MATIPTEVLDDMAVSAREGEWVGSFDSAIKAWRDLATDAEHAGSQSHLDLARRELARLERLNAMATRIAAKHLHIETLEARNRDADDFHEVAVWSLRDALMAAYQAGERGE